DGKFPTPDGRFHFPERFEDDPVLPPPDYPQHLVAQATDKGTNSQLTSDLQQGEIEAGGGPARAGGGGGSDRGPGPVDAAPGPGEGGGGGGVSPPPRTHPVFAGGGGGAGE